MKKSGKRLGRRELKRRIRAIMLSSVMTVTMAFSNMAGLYPAVVQADDAEDAAFKTYFGNVTQSIEGGTYWVPNANIDLSGETVNLKKTDGSHHCMSNSDKTINLAGHTINLGTNYNMFYVKNATVTISDSGGGKIEGVLYTLQGGNIEIQGGTFNKIAVGGYDTQSSLSVSGGHIEELQVGRNVSFTHTGGTIRTIESTASSYHGVNFDPGEGSGLMSACLVTGNSYTLPTCTFTAPANKEFAGWSVGSEVKQARATVTLTGDITITATWRPVQSSNTQPATPAATPGFGE